MEPKPFPFEEFRVTYPHHADRVELTVKRRYTEAVASCRGDIPLSMFTFVANEFIPRCKGNNLDELVDTFVGGVPLVLAEQTSRVKLVNSIGETPKISLVNSFDKWSSTKEVKDAKSATAVGIYSMATMHICNWLNTLSTNLKLESEIWDVVDTQRRPPSLHERLMGAIRFATIEQFITEKYAPKDLFGPTQ